MQESSSPPGETARTLRRIVYLTPDLSTLGGIQSRTRKILRNAGGRAVEYLGLSLHNQLSLGIENNLVWDSEPERILEALERWSPSDTVIMFPNNTLRLLTPDLRARVDRFPLIFNGSGQLTFILQDSEVMADVAYAENLLVSKIILFSMMDRRTYEQFGIYDHEVGFHPVELRGENTFSPARNKRVTYVGRIDFHAKGAERLVEAARALRGSGMGKLRVFTVSNRRNSPQLDDLLQAFAAAGLTGEVEIIYDIEDKAALYGDTSLLLLPSKKESFPNVVVEAYSFGVPVVAMSYAPGPAELVVDGETGFLLDRFDEASLRRVFAQLDQPTLARLSGAAFERHKRYGMDRYYDFIEKVGADTVREFTGVNTMRVYPDLAPIRRLYERVLKADALRNSRSFRIGQAIVTNARSPIGWLRMPFAVVREALRSDGRP